MHSVTADEVEKYYLMIKEFKKTMTNQQIQDHPEFRELRKSQPFLLTEMLSDSMDITIFKKMLSMKRKLEDGEEQYAVDVQFGKYMAKKYIDPIVKNN